MVAGAVSSPYADVLRLPPDHSLTVPTSGTVLRSYWRLEPAVPTPGEDLVERFRELFTAAVRCRLVGPGRVGAMLSGGLDSSSIAAVASPMGEGPGSPPRATLAGGFHRQPPWSERPFTEAGLAHRRFDPPFL